MNYDTHFDIGIKRLDSESLIVFKRLIQPFATYSKAFNHIEPYRTFENLTCPEAIEWRKEIGETLISQLPQIIKESNEDFLRGIIGATVSLKLSLGTWSDFTITNATLSLDEDGVREAVKISFVDYKDIEIKIAYFSASVDSVLESVNHGFYS